MLAGLVGVGGELDAAGLAAAADVHLRLDHHGVADAVGGRHGLVDRVDRIGPSETGMPNVANNCLPWYSRRSTSGKVVKYQTTVPNGVAAHRPAGPTRPGPGRLGYWPP